MVNQHSKPGGSLRNLALYLVAFVCLIAWLPLVRSILDGRSYQWSMIFFGGHLGGAGMGGDFWFLIAQTGLAAATLYLGFRRPGALSYALLVLWLGLNTANWIFAYAQDPEGLVFRGDTFGVSVNIGLFAVAVHALALLAALLGAALELGGKKRPPRFAWTGGNTIALVIALSILPIQFVLLRFATGQAAADQIGVVLTLLQLAAIVFAFAVNRRATS